MEAVFDLSLPTSWQELFFPKFFENKKSSGGAIALLLLGYDVHLHYNDVEPSTSYMRSSSRFAQTGRYLSLLYLTSIKDKPTKTFVKFAHKSIGDYINERTEEELQKLRSRVEGLRGELYGSREGLWQSLFTDREGDGTSERGVPESLGGRGQHDGRSGVSLLTHSLAANHCSRLTSLNP